MRPATWAGNKDSEAQLTESEEPTDIKTATWGDSSDREARFSYTLMSSLPAASEQDYLCRYTECNTYMPGDMLSRIFCMNKSSLSGIMRGS